MPKISDERRLARRQQILDAAWRCFAREGLHVTTMDDIIRASGLSAGAVYGYFRNKDDLILAALTTSLAGLRERLVPLVTTRPLPAPAELVGAVLGEIAAFTEREGFDLKRIALLGWSESQRNETVRGIMAGFYRAFREQLAAATIVWKQEGKLPASLDEQAAAKALLALILGYVVEAAVLGDVTPEDIRRGVAQLGIGSA